MYKTRTSLNPLLLVNKLLPHQTDFDHVVYRLRCTTTDERSETDLTRSQLRELRDKITAALDY